MDFLLHHMLLTSAGRLPAKEALVCGADRLTYTEFTRRTTGLAHALRGAGLERGDRVGICLDPSVAQGVSIFGVSMAGGVFVPINSLLFPGQVSHIAKDCGMTALVTTQSKLADLTSVLEEVPTLRFLVVVGGDGSGGPRLPAHGFETFCDATPEGDGHDQAIEKDLAAILYTSGSTGRPKGVMLSHAQLMAGSTIVSTYLGITERERILAVLPFSFDAGLNQLMTGIQHGGTVVMKTFVFAKEIVDVLLKERITGLAGVPTLWSILSQSHSALHKQPLPDLRYITNTGGRMPESVLKVLRQALPATRIFLMYGLTEAFRSTYLPPEELDRRPSSIGKAIPDTEILVVDEDGRPCGPGESGELVHRGPTVSMGYWDQPELTASVFRPHPWLPRELGSDEKVCYSGDLVKKDEDGFLYFIGRRDNMIKSAGFRISPTEVEEVLFESGRLREAAAIGVPDDVLGQSIKAFVVFQEGKDPATEDLLAFCATRLPRYMVPTTIETMSVLPKTPNGKIDYQALSGAGPS